MTEELIERLRDLRFDALTMKQAVEVRAALKEVLGLFDRWFAELAAGFEAPAKVAQAVTPRKPPPVAPKAVAKAPPAKPAARGRGRPVPDLKVKFPKRKTAPAPLGVGGADAATEGPAPAQIFQDSYLSKDGPQPGARLPADHPRNFINRESSVTAEVDLSDFAEAEEAVRKGQLAKVFQ